MIVCRLFWFSSHFVSVSSELVESVPSCGPVCLEPPYFSLRLQSTEMSELERVIVNLKDTAAGIDQVKAKVLKHAARYIAQVLC